MISHILDCESVCVSEMVGREKGVLILSAGARATNLFGPSTHWWPGLGEVSRPIYRPTNPEECKTRNVRFLF